MPFKKTQRTQTTLRYHTLFILEQLKQRAQLRVLLDIEYERAYQDLLK